MAVRKHREWPTLEEQLEKDHVRKGSALEKLIKENQDFDMLSPEEVHDQFRIPPWLRVYFRRKHPELDFKGPKVGYPLALTDIHKWMLHHQDLPTKHS